MAATATPAVNPGSVEADNATKKRRAKAPSAFARKFIVILNLHKDANPVDQTAVETALTNVLGANESAIRITNRTSSLKKDANAPKTIGVYIAPKGYEFPTAADNTSGGIRLDIELADQLRAALVSMGKEPTADNVRALVAALAGKATGK